MPWGETCAMDRRLQFVADAIAGDATLTELCGRYAISRKTGYKWLGRYRLDGVEGLKERARAPHAHGRARPEELIAAGLALKERWPVWGARKPRAERAGGRGRWGGAGGGAR